MHTAVQLRLVKVEGMRYGPALHVVFIRSNLVVRRLQLFLKRLVLVRLRLPVLHRCDHAFGSSLTMA